MHDIGSDCYRLTMKETILIYWNRLAIFFCCILLKVDSFVVPSAISRSSAVSNNGRFSFSVSTSVDLSGTNIRQSIESERNSLTGINEFDASFVYNPMDELRKIYKFGEERNWPQAIQTFRNILPSVPKSKLISFYSAIIQVACQCKQNNDANKLYQEMNVKCPSDSNFISPSLNLYLMEARFEVRNYRGIIDIFKKVLKYHTSSAVGNNKTEKFEKCIQLYLYALFQLLLQKLSSAPPQSKNDIPPIYWKDFQEAVNFSNLKKLRLTAKSKKTLLNAAIVLQVKNEIIPYLPMLFDDPTAIPEHRLVESLVVMLGGHPGAVLYVINSYLKLNQETLQNFFGEETTEQFLAKAISTGTSTINHFSFTSGKPYLENPYYLSATTLACTMKAVAAVFQPHHAQNGRIEGGGLSPLSAPPPPSSSSWRPRSEQGTIPQETMSSSSSSTSVENDLTSNTVNYLTQLSIENPGKAILTLLSAACHSNQTSIGLIVTALTVCKKTGSWKAALEIYRTSKALLKANLLYDFQMKNNVVSEIPSAVYGLTLVSIAQGGAEAQTFQLCAEMLEAKVIPTSITVDTLFLELSKFGSHVAIIRLLDLFNRYNVPVGSLSFNALLNACDKAGAYSTAINVYSERVREKKNIDFLAVSVLIKCCDRLGLPAKAVEILIEGIKSGSVSSEDRPTLFNRVFAILVKSSAVDLAVALLLYTETPERFDCNISFADFLSFSSLDKHRLPTTTTDMPDHSSSGRSRRSSGGVDNIVANHHHPHQPLVRARRKVGWLDNDIDGLDIAYGTNHLKLSSLEYVESTDDITYAFDEDDKPPVRSPHSSPSSVDSEGNDSSLEDQMKTVIVTEEMTTPFLQEVIELKTVPSIDSIRYYTAAITCLSKVGKGKQAVQLLHSYRDRGGVEEEPMYTSAIHSFKYCHNVEAAEAVFRELQERGGGPILSPMQNLKAELESARTNKGSELRKVSASVNTTIASYNALMTVYAAAGVPSQRLEWLLNDLQRRNLTWDIYTYTAAMTSQTSSSEIIQLWQKMIAAGITPTIATLVLMLKACVSERQGLKAQEALELSIAQGVFPELSYFVLTLLALKEEGRWEESLSLLDSMRMMSIPPSKLCYGLTMSCLERAGKWRQAINIIVQIGNKGLHKDMVTLAISACNRAGQFSTAIKLYEKIPLLVGPNAMIGKHTYNMVLNACWKSGNADMALKILDSKLRQGLVPTMMSISLILCTLEDSRRFPEAAKVFDRLIANFVQDQEYAKAPSINNVAKKEDDSIVEAVSDTDTDTGNGGRSSGRASSDMVVDLHGYTSCIARSLIRSALHHLFLLYHTSPVALPAPSPSDDATPSSSFADSVSGKSNNIIPNLIIITGIGRNSRDHLEPVLKPSVMLWLETCFSPSLKASEISGNPGRLIVSSERLSEWIISRKGLLERTDDAETAADTYRILTA